MCIAKFVNAEDDVLWTILELIADDFSANSLRQFILENNNSGILVGSGVLLDIVLDIFFKLLARLSTLGEDDAGLDDLSSYLVGSGGNTALKNIGKLHDDILDLKGSDTVAR